MRQIRTYTIFRRSLGAKGQAMTEFVILLIAIMTMCAGMLYVSRLLTFQYWAQQEARLIAFEQTWHAHSAYTDPATDPIENLDDGPKYRRPRAVERLQDDANKQLNNDGDVTDLTGFWAKLNLFDFKPAKEEENQPQIMLAKRARSIWSRRTDELFDGEFSLVSTAFASQGVFGPGERGGDVWMDDDLPPKIKRAVEHSVKLERGMQRVLEMRGFGDSFCAAMTGFMERRGLSEQNSEFSSDDCGRRYNRDFGMHLAHNVDFQNLFRDFGYQLEGGFGEREALQVALEQEISGQFYSFFDTTVRAAMIGAIPYIVAQRLDYDFIEDSQYVLDLITDARYMGSSVAVTTIAGDLATLSVLPPGSNADDEFEFEQTVNEVLHHDAADFFGSYAPGVDNGFFLNPFYLPVPPYFGQVAGSLQSGLMLNVLSNEDGGFLSVGDDITDTLVHQSNKEAIVEYPAQNGLFPAAIRRWGGDRTLRARFYLVTQPWHITRREGPFGDFREKGGQFDEYDEETEEAMLRRRVGGLWLLPSDLTAMMEPITDLLPGELGGVVNVFEGVGGFLEEIITFVKNNPLNDILNFLADLPGIGAIVPTFPEWPSVRPGAYPNSEELTGNDGEGSDELMGESRDFDDYIKEQKNNDPKPDPKFN